MTLARVKMWGTTIGAVALEEGRTIARFEHDAEFARSGIQVAPLTMPLGASATKQVHTFPELDPKTFYGLPGLLADSLPDRFGHALIDAWLATQGREPNSMNAVERLCYTGHRGMGALAFEPALTDETPKASQLQVDELVALASTVLSQRASLETSFKDPDQAEAVRDILRVGTSAGGARAKAVIAWNPETNEVRSGQVYAGTGFEYWLMKFDGVRGNKDKELDDPQGYGAIEYAYANMARDTGIEMSPCRLFEENGRRHFMTRRFDRIEPEDSDAAPESTHKIHMQSLCAMAHYDFNLAGAYGYEQAFRVIRQLGLPMEAIEQMYRRMVFNIVARNQDDHVKNIAFLMDRRGTWSLAPAFDLTYSYNPDGDWTCSHQMTLNGKRDDFTQNDFKACARNAAMKRGRDRTIIGEVQAVVSRWMDYAEQAGVSPGQRLQVQGNLRLDSFE